MTHPGNSEYVLVPREPTREMLVAAFEQANDQLLRSNKHCKTDEERSAFAVSALYRAMLAAAPAITTWHRIDDPVKAALEKRPVAFRCRDQHGWVLFEYEDVAARYAESLGLEYEGLYARSAPLTKDPRP